MISPNGHSLAAEIKALAAGRETEILVHVAGIPAELLDGKHHHCPACEGRDRFRLIDRAAGAVLCNQCFRKRNGDFIAAVQHYCGLGHIQACDRIREYLGCTFQPKHCHSKPKQCVSSAKEKAGKARKPLDKHHRTAEAAIQATERWKGKSVGRWKYQNSSGEITCWVVRWNRPDGEKEFHPFSRFAQGWRCAGPVGSKPLYNLPAVLHADEVYVCEGEKAADALISIGLTATTSINGAKSAHKSDWTPLVGKRVRILPDNDPDGEFYASSVNTILGKLDKLTHPAIVRIPGLSPKGDAHDWLESHGDAAEPTALVAELERLAAEAIKTCEAKKTSPTLKPVFKRLSDIVPVETVWLWRDRIPLGGLTTIVGYGGEGKSFFACAVASAVSRGVGFPDGSPCPLGSTVILAGEDSDTRLHERYSVNRADMSKIILLKGAKSAEETSREDEEDRAIAITLADIETIQATIELTNDCKLVIIDPAGDFIPGINSDKDNEVRSLLNPISRLASRKGLAVLLLCHRNKTLGNRADNGALGSVAFVNKARAVHHILYDPRDESPERERKRLFLPGKINDAPKPMGLSFVIQEPYGLISWSTEPEGVTADEALQVAAAKARGDRAGRGPEPTAKKEAKKWLQQVLRNGARLQKEIEVEAEVVGITKGTLRRAREELDVDCHRLMNPGPWYWKLPEASAEGGRD